MWNNGMEELDAGRYAPSLGLLLDATAERAVMRPLRLVTENDLLLSLMRQRKDAAEFLHLPEKERDAFESAASLLKNFLCDGVRATDCIESFDAASVPGAREINPLLRASWRDPLPEVIEALPDGASLMDLLAGLFGAAGRMKNANLLCGLFRVDELISAIEGSRRMPEPFAADGALAPDAFRPRALYLIESALALAGRTGAARAECAHLISALLLYKESFTNLLIRREGKRFSPAAVEAFLQNTYGALDAAAAPLEKAGGSFDGALSRALSEALRRAATEGRAAAGERELLMALVDGQDSRVMALMETALHLAARELRETAASATEPEIIEPRLPEGVGECRNLTRCCRELIPRDDLVEAVMRVLYRKKNRNVLLYGEPGTGRSAAAEMLACEMRKGRFQAFRQAQVIRFDLTSLAPEAYEPAVEKLLAFMEEESGLVYVLEGFQRYFTEHYAACARRFARNAYPLIVVADVAALTRLETMAEPVQTFMEPVRVPEPGRDDSLKMVEGALPALEKEYGVTFPKGVAATAVRMAGDYLISRRFPKKAVELLERTAADVAARCEMEGRADRMVTRERVADRLSSETGLPAETILGTGADKDYVYLLSRQLVGQEYAVRKVAGRLDLIQKGMVDKKAPSAVFVFAGLSGTGKTELAKQIAQIYSQSRKLISFEMANFGEAHSVSRLIGTPPGYVGYEEGGKLINDLNRDPYSVVLLDEIEKANPAVWDPFLNLFDEGVITDMRGVTASGSKAFFVLTSNIGQYDITRMLREGRSQEEIEDVVMKQFTQERHYKTHEPCFRPEFIGRVMRRGGIVVFNALSYQAMQGIARIMFGKIAKEFSEVHDSRLVCDDQVIDMIAKTVFDENEEVIRARGNGYFGGRRLDIMMDQHIRNKLARQLRQLSGAPVVRVVLDGGETAIVPVFSDGDAQALLKERQLALLSRVSGRFGRLLDLPDNAFDALDEGALSRLDALMAEIGDCVREGKR
jgi:ATP-dependent Clp protease ATP-binding subunit ClpA